MNEIPGGPLEGAVENHGTQAIESAGRHANTCATCSWAMPLSPGHAIICGEKWQRCEWNDAVPLTIASDSCSEHRPLTDNYRRS